jgi:hypothetical protein
MQVVVWSQTASIAKEKATTRAYDAPMNHRSKLVRRRPLGYASTACANAAVNPSSPKRNPNVNSAELWLYWSFRSSRQ